MLLQVVYTGYVFQGNTDAIQSAMFEPKLRMHLTMGIQWNVQKTVGPGPEACYDTERTLTVTHAGGL